MTNIQPSTASSAAPSTLPPLTREAQEFLNRVRREPQFFCEKYLKIKDKDNNLVEWRWNSAQNLLFAAIWSMFLRVGYVRLLGVKGRQQGFSTLVAGLYMWLAVIHAKKVIVIAHKQDSTEILFEKMQTMYDNLDPMFKPEADTSNAKQLKFRNGGSITCVTAGSGEAGRGDTAQAQHRSEVAFFPDPGAVKKGVGRTVSKLKGTFIIQESTGNGENDFYHDVMKAVKGKGVYEYVFVPWFIQEEYRSKPPTDFARTEYEEQIANLFNLDDWQLQWRRLTMDELDEAGKPGEVAFKQEYPNTLEEAFQSSNDSFFPPELVVRAKKAKVEPFGHEPKLLGVDPGRTRDRTVLMARQGPKAYEPEIHPHMESMQLAGIIIHKIDNEGFDYVFIDVGMGWGTIDRLREMGYGKYVIPVDFGSKANEDRFANLRANMFFNVLDWLKQNVSLPDNTDVSSDFAALPMFKQSSTGRIIFPTKDEIRKVIKRSTDILDAFATTFAYPVKSKEIRRERQKIDMENAYNRGYDGGAPKRPSGLSARRHVESMREGYGSNWRQRG